MKLRKYLLECEHCKRKMNVEVLGEIVDAGLCHFCGNSLKIIGGKDGKEEKTRKNRIHQ